MIKSTAWKNDLSVNFHHNEDNNVVETTEKLVLHFYSALWALSY